MDKYRPTHYTPDARDGRAYVLVEELSFAVDVALATGRPLLVRGEPGSGKSSLAAHVARERGWRYYEYVVTSRTTARDLLWSFDAVRRLADAQVATNKGDLHDADYVEPGVLWWAIAPDSARRRGATQVASAGATTKPARDPNPENTNRSPEHAVVLIDEIDKADPDMPNGILVPLGSREFFVPEIATTVRPEHPVGKVLVVITTNEERELPQAFLRRCVVGTLPAPTPDHLVKVAECHFGLTSTAERELAAALADQLIVARDEAVQLGLRPPSTAEYLDALVALRELSIDLNSIYWQRLRQLTFVKDKQLKD